MRAGTRVLACALLLMFGGIASTKFFPEPPKDTSRVVTLDGAAPPVVDMTAVHESGLRDVRLARQAAPTLTFDTASPDAAAPLVAQRRGAVLSLAPAGSDTRLHMAKLRLPVELRELTGRAFDVSAEAPAGVLRLSGNDVTWSKGDAERLEIRMVTRAATGCRGRPRRFTSTFDFSGGSVGVLRVSAAAGRISLGDLSQVGTIELHIGRDVTLAVARVRDLERIRIVMLDDAVLYPQGRSTANPVAGESGACAGAAAASALEAFAVD